uniref:Retrovirus-related Pol polyprotein from transposon TNT 1-94 n=1 Tax=Cajanus cajan TaxID=3821 RepID=A0A151RAU9_CAJCA|nr:Retrovirus-related Pol polyprotein from transposon TNT 1-94 [Cajanus cajan]
MKDVGRTKFCLRLQIEYLENGILVHQEAYITKVLKRFYMDKSHPLCTPMVVRSLNVNKDPFRPQEKDEEILGTEVPYLSAIGALMYLTNYTRPDTTFAVNLLARHSSSPTRRHWNGVKKILCYLRGTMNMGLLYSNVQKIELNGYADASYLSDPQNGKSQTRYLFTSGGTTISWGSVKQTISTTSSNHAEILALHEASRECVWLRSVIQHIRETCGLSSGKMTSTVIYEDNVVCIAKLKDGYIKGDRMKHILPKLFFTHDLQRNGDINFQKFRSSDNLANLFTKSLPRKVFEQIIHKIGLYLLKDCMHEW